ncbi:MAG: hypothetical protein IKB03_00510 [Tidjanibacter sp.]|nr:hypothetical protein [Tidjanibacter sp.]
MMKIVSRTLMCAVMVIMAINTYAQSVNNSPVLLEKTIISESTIMLHKVTNTCEHWIEVSLYNGAKRSGRQRIEKGETFTFNQECERVDLNSATGSVQGTLWNKADTAAEWRRLHGSKPQPVANKQEAKQTTPIKEEVGVVTPIIEDVEQPNKEPKKHIESVSTPKKKISSEELIADFVIFIEKDTYLSHRAIATDADMVNRHIECLTNWNDKEAYVVDQHLDKYLKDEWKRLNEYQKNTSSIVGRFVKKYDKYVISGEESYVDKMCKAVEERLSRRESKLIELQTALNIEDGNSTIDWKWVIACGVVVGLIILIMVVRKKRVSNGVSDKRVAPQYSTATNTEPAIVVRKKTTTLLKKQSLDDVVNSNSYFVINSSDFCADSAVKKIYIKNTCIKEVYNMYAEDLRNPANPKEDGCMVLGRWVFDEATKEYDISLETVVKPGDDAIFKEYELNFGGKIKLKVADQLRKLRRDTDLQYDLTCWIHSHPGLGVFFSNSDSSVQMQLKHPIHPNFLIAFVIDILTPQQEMGIFTFKHNSTINSKNDITKMYSLEELHQWAIESERNAAKLEDYYDCLAKATKCDDSCHSISLSNSAIIDTVSITNVPHTGLVGWVYGFFNNSNGKRDYLINQVSMSDTSLDGEKLGCLVVGTHCSIPSIRRTIAPVAQKVNFVLFYSSTEGVLTAIPIIDGQLCGDDAYYSEEKLEDLKIWTRRKR